MCSTEQMCEHLITQFGYTLDNIPISLGGTFNPIDSGTVRYQICLSKVTNNQSICYPYYFSDYQPLTTKSTNNILSFNTDYQNHDKSIPSPPTAAMSSPSSFLAFVSLRRNKDIPSQVRIRKRESSSSSSDTDKRSRSNEDLIDDESSMFNSSSLLRKENVDE